MIERRTFFSLLLSLCILAFPSCLRDGGETPGGGGVPQISYMICPEVIPSECALDVSRGTRSSIVGDADSVGDVNIFVYRDGKLEWEIYRETMGPVEVLLTAGESYSVYATANTGKISAPDSEADIHGYEVDALPGKGLLIPMASDGGVTVVVPESGGGGEILIGVKRLFARFDFGIDLSSLLYGSFRVTGVQLCQAARRVEAFGSGSRAEGDGSIMDGDYASADDLAVLNSSGRLTLYVPENMQGTLLPSNSDPWAKEYYNSAIGSSRDLCTYLRVEGEYTDRSGAMTATHVYKMYLGEDSTTNFDIGRNTVYGLTLSVSDLGVYRESWKVERLPVRDERSLRFVPSTVEISPNSSQSITLVRTPSTMDFNLEWDSAQFSSAGLAAPVLSGSSITITSTRVPPSETTLYLRARSFDSQVSALCTLRVSKEVREELGVAWLSGPPSYVAQSGTVICSNVYQGSVLSAVSENEDVAELVRCEDGFKVNALKEGSTVLTFTRTDGNEQSSRSLTLDVSAVDFISGENAYVAYADAGANAVGVERGTPWSVRYSLPESEFDPELYERLLKPLITVERNFADVSAVFSIDEDGLFVRDISSLAALAGTYTVYVTSKENVWSKNAQTLTRTVRVDAPVPTGLAFECENRFYMPDAETVMSVEAAGTVSVGNRNNLRICISRRGTQYGEGSGYLQCPWTTNGGNLMLSPRYDDIPAAFSAPWYLRGTLFNVWASLTNEISGQTEMVKVGGMEVWLDIAVTSGLDSWDSGSDYDVADGDPHLYIVPCIYDERLPNGFITFSNSSAGSGGDLSLPPYYIPRNILEGIPEKVNLGGAEILLSEPYGGLAAPRYQISAQNGKLLCPDVTNWLWDQSGSQALESGFYEELKDSSPKWFHRKLWWRLRDPRDGSTVPEGGSFDIESSDAYNYHLRLYDYASQLDPSEFE